MAKNTGFWIGELYRMKCNHALVEIVDCNMDDAGTAIAKSTAWSAERSIALTCLEEIPTFLTEASNGDLSSNPINVLGS
jgi:hypothetical protein